MPQELKDFLTPNILPSEYTRSDRSYSDQWRSRPGEYIYRRGFRKAWLSYPLPEDAHPDDVLHRSYGEETSEEAFRRLNPELWEAGRMPGRAGWLIVPDKFFIPNSIDADPACEFSVFPPGPELQASTAEASGSQPIEVGDSAFPETWGDRGRLLHVEESEEIEPDASCTATVQASCAETLQYEAKRPRRE